MSLLSTGRFACALVWPLASAAQEGAPDSARAEALVSYVRAHAESPDSFLLRAFEAHHLVFLGDVHPAAEPKRLVARLLPVLKARGRLDVLVLEVPFEQQPVIDAYLRSEPEDVELLIGHPLTLRAHWGAAQEYLEIYRAAWAANREVAGGRRIRIVAVDAPRGPPQAASERDGVARFARRDAVMASQILREVLTPDPDAYVLFFLGGYHGLKGWAAEAEWNGARARVRWMADRLRERWPEPVYTVLTDGGPAPAPYRGGASYGATRWYALFESRLEGTPRPPFVVPVSAFFDLWPDPWLEPEDGLVTLRLLAADPGSAATPFDAYLYLGRGDRITPLGPAP